MGDARGLDPAEGPPAPNHLHDRTDRCRDRRRVGRAHRLLPAASGCGWWTWTICPGRVLEIGTGWGSLAIRAAERGATVTSLTISVEQQRLAESRAAAADVADRVSVELRDYREATGRYDAVVSVEMVERQAADAG